MNMTDPGKDDHAKQFEDALAAAQAGAMDNHRMMELFTGINDEGRNFYAYVAVIPSKFMEYRTLIERGEEVDLEAYGEVLEFGFSMLPPVDVQKKMSDMGFQHDLEEQIFEHIEKQRG